MDLTKEQIKHIAELARLQLTEKELEIYGNQLSRVLGFIDQLQEVDTDDVEPTSQVTGLENVLREDTAREWDKKESKEALEQAPEIKNGQVKVKRVLE